MLEKQQEFEYIQPKEFGHLSGGIYKHKPTGNKFLIKEPYSDGEAKNEILAAKLYELAGVKTVNLELSLFNEKTVIISKWIEDYSNLGYNQIPFDVTGLYENFAIDAWLANWDVIGLDNDNIGFSGNEAIRIDLGGALLYRGMGALKGSMFSNKVGEVCNFLNLDINYNSASIFKNIKVKHFLEGIKKINNIKPEELSQLITEYSTGNPEEKEKLFQKLYVERKNDLNEKASFIINNSAPESYLKIELCGKEYSNSDVF